MKMNNACKAIVLSLCLMLLAVPAMAGHGAPQPDKKAILLATFGSTVPEARAPFAALDKEVRAAFPGVEVRWAYTARKVRNTIANEQDMHVDSPAVALARLGDEGFNHVAVQSLHMIPGLEFLWLMHTAERFEGMPKSIKQVEVGKPLMYSAEDMERVAKAIMTAVPADRKAGEAVVFMGHGTSHAANAFYPALQYYLNKLDETAFVGTVEGSPSLDDILGALKKNGVKKAYLLPLMSVAGDHTVNDMASDEPDSWKSEFKANGITPVTVVKGMASVPAVRAIWIDHLKTAFDELD
ncbi:sirohydrochlorin cobaltochelatase [Oleidesulfovibrio sp.]|uniref:sirohydrochlorin cobaltochelatase n=1 Tax=Oleidesulfovibrio sp. TaxID=2909707 RepID=UPI003A88B079